MPQTAYQIGFLSVVGKDAGYGLAVLGDDQAIGIHLI